MGRLLIADIVILDDGSSEDPEVFAKLISLKAWACEIGISGLSWTYDANVIWVEMKDMYQEMWVVELFLIWSMAPSLGLFIVLEVLGWVRLPGEHHILVSHLQYADDMISTWSGC